jgi:glycosyltransferase involved in cell wall biosynthesis
MTAPSRVRALSFTTLFPNPLEPYHGLFVRRRLEWLARECDLEVVAPVNVARSPAALWAAWGKSRDGDLPVQRPRFVVVPKVLKEWDARLLFWETWAQVGARLEPRAFDLLDAHYAYPDGAAAALLARRLGIPLVLSVRGSDIEILARDPRRRPIIADALRRAAAVIAVSESLRRGVEALGVEAANVHVIPNGIDPRTFHPVDRAAAREALSVAPGDRVVVSVGRLSPVKGLDLLVEAMGALHRHDEPPARCFIVGAGPLRGELKRRVRSLGLSKHVQLVGAIPPERLPLFYGAADITCLLSLSEGCPNVVLESLACGTPVVATRVGGVPELVRDGENGLLLDARDPRAATELIRAALARPWNRAGIAEQAAGHTWPRVASRHLGVFRAVLRRTGES